MFYWVLPVYIQRIKSWKQYMNKRNVNPITAILGTTAKKVATIVGDPS